MIYKISTLSYSNSLPFVYGLQNFDFRPDFIELTLGNPSLIADNLINHHAAVGLVPVASIPGLPDYRIVTDFCISSSGPVASVMLYSDSPLSKIKRIYLDYQSRTSVILIKILAKIFWHSRFEYTDAGPGYESMKLNEGEALVMIGDRALQNAAKFTHRIDLSEQWLHFTQLPFVFAVWVAHKDVDLGFIEKLGKALQLGVGNIPKVVARHLESFEGEMQLTLNEYLTKRIQYNLDDEKRKVIEMFLRLTRQINN